MQTAHDNRKHARLSGSKIDRASLCPGSVQLEATIPETEPGAAALRGTAIHEIAEAIMRGEDVPKRHSDKPAEWVAEARAYATTLQEYTEPWAKKRMVELNTTPGLQGIHDSLGGTADYVAIGGGRILVADLKTGRTPVDPTNNPQLMTYAVGAVLQLKAPPGVAVTLAIYQAGQLKTWDTDHGQLMDWADALRHIAARVWSPQPQRTPSSSACQWCRAKAVCPELADAARSIAANEAHSDFSIEPPPVDVMFPAPVMSTYGLRGKLDTAALLEGWIDAVRAHAKTVLDDGTAIPGWRLKKGRRMIQIADADKLAQIAKGVPEAWTLKTPAQLQKLDALPSSLFVEVNAAPSLVRSEE